MCRQTSFFKTFCQTHQCGLFIQKHPSVLTIYLSLSHSRVFVFCCCFFVCFLCVFFRMFILRYTISPLVTVQILMFVRFVTLNISGPEPSFKYDGQGKGGVNQSFVNTYTSAINMMRFIRLCRNYALLFRERKKKSTTVKWVRMSKVIKIYCA